MRIAVLWTGLSGYMNACLKELARRPDVELFVAHMPIAPEAPFDPALFEWLGPDSGPGGGQASGTPGSLQRFIWRSAADAPMLSKHLRRFAPEVTLVAGWHEPVYRPVMRALRGQGFRLMAFDNCWQGTAKQLAGAAIAGWHVLPMADAAFVPGERQELFARKMGFRQVIHGSLSCDTAAFEETYRQRGAQPQRAFLFAGRLREDKGLAVLAQAYAEYRQRAQGEPWPLIVCGTGAMSTALEGKPGIELCGFVQPNDLPREMARAGCFVLPSLFEPWALAIHEAAAAGMAIVATSAVGAVPHLVHTGAEGNGWVVPPGNVQALCQALLEASALTDEQLLQKDHRSWELSQQFSPRRWANVLTGLALQNGQESGRK